MTGHHSTLRVTQRGSALVVQMDRPDADNSIDAEMLRELHDALDSSLAADDQRIVVLRGGDGVFCTGMDLAAGDAGGPDLFLSLLERFTSIPRLVVAEVDGRVSGGGVGLAAAADVVHATPRSTFALPEALWGLLPYMVMPFLVRRVGPQLAGRMTITTTPLDVGEAGQRGLVDRVTDRFEPELRRLMSRLDKVDPTTIGRAKAYLERFSPHGPEIRAAALDGFASAMSDPAVRARIEAFTTSGRYPWEVPA